MDKGPFRGARTDETRTSARSAGAPSEEAVEKEVTVEAPSVELQRPIQRTERPRPRASSRRTRHADDVAPKKNRLGKVLAVLIAVAVVAAFGWFLLGSRGDVADAIDRSKYQAVFFTNGQVYFGKLHKLNHESMRITEVYYLRSQETDGADGDDVQQASTAQNGVELIKLGDEIHKPMDEMVVLKSQILFYENIKDEGSVAQTIEKYKRSHE